VTPDNLADPLWRLQSLYSCRREGVGTALPFRPRPEQFTLYRHLIETPHIPAYVIKSRRLGISTAIDTFMADQAVFSQGFRGLIIDQKQDDATKKMVEIVRFAVDSLDPLILQGVKFDKRNDSELRLRLVDEPESQDSVVFATTGGRGGDCSMLHVSEWGPISATDPTRSREIRTGTFPAARLGRRVVETTWYGGKAGDLWELIKPILERDPNAEGVVYFFPWHADPAAIKLDGTVTQETEDYFRELAEKTSKAFNPEQKKWYAAKKIEQGIFVKREYPSTLEEAFSAPVEGSIFGDILMELRGKGRIAPFEFDRSLPVFSSWDLGWNDSTSVWLWQIVGPEMRWLWHARETGKTAAEMAHIVRESGIPVAAHYLPHDADSKNAATGISYKMALVRAGFEHCHVVPRSTNIWDGINELRSLLKRSTMHATACEEGIKALEFYHTKPITSGGSISREPVHDWSSHDASAARCAAEALILGMVKAPARKLVRELAGIDPRDPLDIASVRRGPARLGTAVSDFRL
jgi:hypothetical protein